MVTSRFRNFSLFLLLCVFVVQLAGIPALANHPGHNLDAVMGNKEKFFQAIGKDAPAFTLSDAKGRNVSLADFRGKVVILHFIYTRCPDVCPLHAERIAEIQAMISETPMKDRVQFISITTDPQNDTPKVLREYGPSRGLKPDNWIFLRTAPGQAEDATRKLAERFGHKFIKTDNGYQVHGVVTHVIDREGRWAANFHGLRFEPVNLVLYINGLTHKTNLPNGLAAPGFWQRLRELF